MATEAVREAKSLLNSAPIRLEGPVGDSRSAAVPWSPCKPRVNAGALEELARYRTGFFQQGLFVDTRQRSIIDQEVTANHHMCHVRRAATEHERAHGPVDG